MKCRECSSSSLVDHYGLTHKRGHVGHHPPAIHVVELKLIELKWSGTVGENFRRESYEDIILKIRSVLVKLPTE